jgi:hypothetical protein
LIVALGQAFTSENAIVPSSNFGLDAVHAVEGSECYGCHKSLDPIRQFWATEFDFNDRNDFPAATRGRPGTSRPTTVGGGFAWGNVNATGTSMVDLGRFLSQVVDSTETPPVSRFALAMTQKLCYFADSAACDEHDPEMRRVALAFQSSNFNFKVLVRELMSSPLVTIAAPTKTHQERNVVISITRRDHLCEALSNRLGKPDLCALSVAFPFQTGFGGQSSPYAAQRTTFRIAGSVAADGFSRSSEVPVTPTEPTLFQRAATELLCEDIAAQVVDADGGRYASSDPEAAMGDMVQTIMGYSAGDPARAEALQILKDHYQEARTSSNNARNALRATFALACQSPTFVAIGL